MLRPVLAIKLSFILTLLFALTSCRYDVNIDVDPKSGSVKYEMVASGELREYLLDNPEVDQRILSTISDVLNEDVVRTESNGTVIYKSEAIYDNSNSVFSGIKNIKNSNTYVSLDMSSPNLVLKAIESATSDLPDSEQKFLAYSNSFLYNYRVCVDGYVYYTSVGDISGNCAVFSTSLAEFPENITWEIEYKEYSFFDRIKSPLALPILLLLLFIALKKYRR